MNCMDEFTQRPPKYSLGSLVNNIEAWTLGGRIFHELGPDSTLTKLSKLVLDKFCGSEKVGNSYITSQESI